MNKSTYITNNLKETQKIAFDLAQKLSSDGRGNTSAMVIALRGELGGGKTSFTQGFAKGLSIKSKILSPTFNIFKIYPVKKTRPSQARPSLVLYHFDCYRINKAKEILDLGFEEIISNPNNIVVIEWAERVKKILPKNTLWITFKFINEDKREITF